MTFLINGLFDFKISYKTHVERKNEKEEHIWNICYQIKTGICFNAN